MIAWTKPEQQAFLLVVAVVLAGIGVQWWLRAVPSGRQRMIPLHEVTIDLNRVSEEELAHTRGISPGLARAIVAYRDEQGGFRCVEELRQVKGVGEKRLRRLQPLFRVP